MGFNIKYLSLTWVGRLISSRSLHVVSVRLHVFGNVQSFIIELFDLTNSNPFVSCLWIPIACGLSECVCLTTIRFLCSNSYHNSGKKLDYLQCAK